MNLGKEFHDYLNKFLHALELSYFPPIDSLLLSRKHEAIN